MRLRRAVRRVVTVILAATTAGLAACGGQGAGLDGTAGAGTWAGVTTLPGMPADYTGFLGNHTGQVVVLRSASILPLKGFPAPRLVHLAVEPGLAFAANGIGWPPRYGKNLHLVPFAGRRIPDGRRTQILYGVVAPRVGEYGDAGIRVTVLIGGTSVTVNVLSAAGTCVRLSLPVNCPESFYHRIEHAAG